MSIYTFLICALFAHWIADFCLQTRWQADNKSKNILALGEHVYIYTIALWLMVLLGLRGYYFLHSSPFPTTVPAAVLAFIVENSLAHFCTDFCTSKLTSYFWKKKDIHSFFVTIGFDQFIHTSILVLTAQALLERI